MIEKKSEISLKALRSLRGISQKNLADKIDRHESTILNWEKGRTSMTIEDYLKVKNLLDPKDEFFLQIKSSLSWFNTKRRRYEWIKNI